VTWGQASLALMIAAGSTFIALYVTALMGRSEPEVALFRAGAAGIVLALLGRLALWILDGGVEASTNVDSPEKAAQPSGDPRAEGSADLGNGRVSQ